MKRIQRKRLKGWRMPENCKYIGRPTKWGNPFRDFRGKVYIKSLNHIPLGELKWIYICEKSENFNAIKFYRDCLRDNTMVYVYCMDLDPLSQGHWHTYFERISACLHELQGYDLCCWCAPDARCHGDVLIELLNKLK